MDNEKALHSCYTYFSIHLNDGLKQNLNEVKSAIEQIIKDVFKETPKWKRNHLSIGFNASFQINVNDMLRITLKNLFGKEKEILKLKNKYNLSTFLEIVPTIAFSSEEPRQILSLEPDIIDFLYKTKTIVDLDYYII